MLFSPLMCCEPECPGPSPAPPPTCRLLSAAKAFSVRSSSSRLSIKMLVLGLRRDRRLAGPAAIAASPAVGAAPPLPSSCLLSCSSTPRCCRSDSNEARVPNPSHAA
jgi:hypothetical protein